MNMVCYHSGDGSFFDRVPITSLLLEGEGKKPGEFIFFFSDAIPCREGSVRKLERMEGLSSDQQYEKHRGGWRDGRGEEAGDHGP